GVRQVERQPNGRHFGVGPAHPVAGAGGNQRKITPTKSLDPPVFELDAAASLEYCNPFVLGLVVPKIRRRGVPAGNDSQETKAGATEQDVGLLLRARWRKIRE